MEILQITIRELEKALLASTVKLGPKGKGEILLTNGGGFAWGDQHGEGEVLRGTT